MIAPIGKLTVPVPGTPVAVQALLAQPTKPYLCHGVMFQALPTNTGRIFIGTVEMDSTTLANVFAILAIPTDNQLPTFSAALTISPNGLKLNEFYIDAEVPDDGVLITVLVT